MTEERRTIPMITRIDGDLITVERVYEDDIEWTDPRNALDDRHDDRRDEKHGD